MATGRSFTVGEFGYYCFSINSGALTSKLWVTGTGVCLPRGTFEPEPEDRWQGLQCTPSQWANHVPVRPIARLTVTPNDFPFLDQVRSHDQQVVTERATQDPDNFSWLAES